MIYFCFGNGNSRKDLDLDKFKQHGKVVGCNAIYRDFNPDILVALDTAIAHEIYRSGYVFKNTTYHFGHANQSKNFRYLLVLIRAH